MQLLSALLSAPPRRGDSRRIPQLLERRYSSPGLPSPGLSSLTEWVCPLTGGGNESGRAGREREGQCGDREAAIGELWRLHRYAHTPIHRAAQLQSIHKYTALTYTFPLGSSHRKWRCLGASLQAHQLSINAHTHRHPGASTLANSTSDTGPTKGLFLLFTRRGETGRGEAQGCCILLPRGEICERRLFEN
ncbi:hypothetical protein XELAEV_18040591mg [Xenopus laevis]|uniref:Uncharacterized protein n=1 Tax=Xenopus laevis TaxID=8355 RepID=A0A974C9S6_XENLA|nr:hypothetical protein XELAEV_18040591mg [Xenopus laevis]